MRSEALDGRYRNDYARTGRWLALADAWRPDPTRCRIERDNEGKPPDERLLGYSGLAEKAVFRFESRPSAPSEFVSLDFPFATKMRVISRCL